MNAIIKRTVGEFNRGLSEDFCLNIDNKKISVSLYKDLGNYHVECINELNDEKRHNMIYSFGRLEQARPVFLERIAVAKTFLNKK